MKTKIFYRVANKLTKEGLWYNKKGDFTGLIHDEFTFCKNTKLKMPFNKDIVGYLSAAKDIPELLDWFPIDDLYQLENYNYRVALYECLDYKQISGHWAINQKTSKLITFVKPLDIDILFNKQKIKDYENRSNNTRQ